MKRIRMALMILTAVLLLSIGVNAQNYDLLVSFGPDDAPIADITFDIYKVDGTSSDELAVYGALLEAGTAPVGTVTTNDYGTAVFADLPGGSYLLVGDADLIDGKLVEPTMALLTLTGNQENLVVKPKYEISTPPAKKDYKLQKLWEDKVDPSARPKEIEITLYRDGKEHKNVKLSADNNWRYTWTDVDATAQWVAVEKVPTNYEATYGRDGDTFTVTNTLTKVPPTEPEETKPSDPTDPSTPSDPTTPPNPSTPPKPSTPTLPQTGQLWWPVPVMAFSGLVFVLLGLIRRKEYGYEG